MCFLLLVGADGQRLISAIKGRSKRSERWMGVLRFVVLLVTFYPIFNLSISTIIIFQIIIVVLYLFCLRCCKGNSHLGHVFPERGHQGQRSGERHCANSTNILFLPSNFSFGVIISLCYIIIINYILVVFTIRSCVAIC